MVDGRRRTSDGWQNFYTEKRKERRLVSSYCHLFSFFSKMAKAFPKINLRKAFEKGSLSDPLFIGKELFHLVFVDHQFFVGVFSCFWVFYTFDDFYVVPS